ncbi:hypothetical protein KAR91_27860 [Candidatus Pacearchaeota archaeon]|nr:hypothetical protein [Candidatus Pacearchaeota archaeon]
MEECMIDLRHSVLLNATNKQLTEALMKRIAALKDTKHGKTALIEDIETLAKQVNDRLLTEVFHQSKK